MTRGVALKLAGFAGALLLAFGGAFALGGAFDPVADAAPEAAPHSEMEPADPSGTPHGEGHSETGGSTQPPGLAISEAGYTLVPAQTSFAATGTTPFNFKIIGPDGKPLTSYQVTHEKDLHLIVVRRDLAGFKHVHPTRAADGTWSIPFDFTAGGTWRVFADFAPTALGRTLTLGADITVAGLFKPVPLPRATTTTNVEGYDVTLAGTPVAGKESELTFTVRRNGVAVTDLEPYLGAYGHLVSLRSGDLAYLHTHPTEEAVAGGKGGPEIKFGTTFPTDGLYRLYLDFKHGGVVRTAEFTVSLGASGNQPIPTPTDGTTTPHGH